MNIYNFCKSCAVKIAVSEALLLCVVCAQSQTIEGTVIDNNLEPVVGATVCAIDSAESILSATTTDANGKFSLNIFEPIHLRVSHISYETYDLTMTDNKLLTICLVEKNENLDEVVVKARRPAIEMKNGHIVANVSQIPNSETADIAKMLNKVPGVKAKDDEGITINGKSATLYIDGRKQNMDTESAMKMLNSMPASSLEQVEVITENDGTYDAETKAVIVLRTKSKKNDGFFCSVSGYEKISDKTCGIDNFKSSTGTSAFIVARRKNVMFNTTLAYAYNNGSSFSADSTRFANCTIVGNDGYGSFYGADVSCIANLGLDYSSVGQFDLSLMLNDSRRHSRLSDDFQVERLSADSSYSQFAKKKNSDVFASGFVGYESPKGLPFKAKASYSIETSKYGTNGDYFNSTEVSETAELYLHSEPKMFGYQQTANVDLQYKFDSIGLTAFAGAQFDNINITDKIKNGTNLIGYGESDFEAKENIGAVYARLSYDISKKLNLSGSVRLEKDWYEAKLKTDNNSFEKTFTHFIPFASMSYKPNENAILKASLYGSLSRPNYDQMYPGMRYVNEYTYSVGDPNLVPTTARGVSLSGWLFDMCNIGLQYENVSDYIAGVIVSRSEEQSVDMCTNAFDSKEFDTYFNIQHSFFDDKLFAFFNLGAWYVRTTPKNEFVIPDEFRKFWKGEGEFDLNYEITDNLSFSACLWYMPKCKNSQQRLRRLWTFDVGLYADFLDGSLSFALEAEDLFRGFKVEGDTYFGDNVTHFSRISDSRFVKLSVSYSFVKNRDVSEEARYEDGAVNRGRFSRSK